MPATASFKFDDGIATSSWNAMFAFRMRVSMSAIGSVIVIARVLPSPRALRHTGNLARMGHLPDTDAHQPVVELPHAVAAHRDHCADLVALTELERGDRLLGLAHARLLAGNDLEVRDRAVEQRTLLGRAADTHVDHDLRKPRDLHHVR